MSSGVSLFALGALALAARSFHRRGELRLSVVTKVTCRIVPDGTFALAAPRPIVPAERYLGGPATSLAHPGDLALRLPRAQLLVVGVVHAPGGAPCATSTVRLAVARGESMLVDKRLEIVGDRRGPARPSGIGGAQLTDSAAPFVRMPLVYERAFGGAGFTRNPVGTGANGGDDGLAALPNVHYANGRIAEDPAGFGPISSLWPARRELLGATTRQAADRDVAAQLSDDFRDAYFVSAPSDQQVDAWQGGEMIALFQMHPTHQALRMHVPKWVVSAMLQTARGVRVPVPVRLDTILVEPETMSAELVYRGDIRVDSEALREARVGATIASEKVELPDLAQQGPGAPVEGFALGALRGSSASAPPPAERRARDATLVLDEPTAAIDAAPEPPRGTPFEPRRARAGTMVMESSPPPAPAPAPAEPPRRDRANAGTMVIEPDAPAPARPAGPSASSARPAESEEEAPATQVMAVDEPRRARAATVSLDVNDAEPISLPFEKREREARVAVAKAPLPGAPWSPGDYPRPQPTRPGLDETIGLDDDTDADEAPAAAAVPAAPAPAPPPAASPPIAPGTPPAPAPPPKPPVDEKPKPLWREDPPEAPLPAPVPKAPRSRVSFKSDLYKKIKK